MKLPLHEFPFVKATTPFLYCAGRWKLVTGSAESWPLQGPGLDYQTWKEKSALSASLPSQIPFILTKNSALRFPIFFRYNH